MSAYLNLLNELLEFLFAESSFNGDLGHSGVFALFKGVNLGPLGYF